MWTVLGPREDRACVQFNQLYLCMSMSIRCVLPNSRRERERRKEIASVQRQNQLLLWRHWGSWLTLFLEHLNPLSLSLSLAGIDCVHCMYPFNCVTVFSISLLSLNNYASAKQFNSLDQRVINWVNNFPFTSVTGGFKIQKRRRGMHPRPNWT